jgi:hypothetical protein
MNKGIFKTVTALACAGFLSVQAAQAEGFVLGAGRWTCEKAVGVMDGDSGIDKGQLVGWVLGTWTSATFNREKTFIDTVEQVGGQKIIVATIAECRKASPETLVYRVVDTMIRNTK